MFLTTPTIEEFQAFELPELVDLLAIYTDDYIRYLKTEGNFYRTNVLKEYILVIQAAIEIKRSLEKKAQPQMQPSPARDMVQPEKE